MKKTYYKSIQINEINGFFVIHFLNFANIDHSEGLNAVSKAYNRALDLAKPFNGEKFSNQTFGGGIKFSNYESVCEFIDSV